MHEDDFVQERFKKAAHKYQVLLMSMPYDQISAYMVGLHAEIDEEYNIFKQFNFM